MRAATVTTLIDTGCVSAFQALLMNYRYTLMLFLPKGPCLRYTDEQRNQNLFIRADCQTEKRMIL